MEDNDIIELYFRQDEGAIAETAKKYGGLCRSIALNILGSQSDAEACVNDVYFKIWNLIPPKRPQNLRNYAAMVTRSAARQS